MPSRVTPNKPLAMAKPVANHRPVIGRFAPSPTGELHLGSLLTAVASFCIAKQAGGQWLVRIEDVDSERCRPAYASKILTELERLGLHWDGAERYQSKHLALYHELLDTQLGSVSYGCQCSRKSLAALPHGLYDGRCYSKHLARDNAIRLRLPSQQVAFFDQLQGVIITHPAGELGDIVLRRRKTADNAGIINYMLACVVDDGVQQVNQIVRGLDILPLTGAQLLLGDYLGLPPVTTYYHLPLLVNAQGQKLSKQTLAEPIAPKSPQWLLASVLQLLGQRPVAADHPEAMLAQAIHQWDNTPLIGQTQRLAPSLTP